MKESLRIQFEKEACWIRKGEASGETYLHFAAFMGYIEAANALIQDDADVNAVDKLERTALHIAAGEGHVEFANQASWSCIQSVLCDSFVHHFSWYIYSWHMDIFLGPVAFGDEQK